MSTATINMSGGQVESGITVQQGTLNISGGQVTGGSNSNGNIVYDLASAVITGGTFIGSNVGTYPIIYAGSAVAGSAGTIDTARSQKRDIPN